MSAGSGEPESALGGSSTVLCQAPGTALDRGGDDRGRQPRTLPGQSVESRKSLRAEFPGLALAISLLLVPDERIQFLGLRVLSRY